MFEVSYIKETVSNFKICCGEFKSIATELRKSAEKLEKAAMQEPEFAKITKKAMAQSQNLSTAVSNFQSKLNTYLQQLSTGKLEQSQVQESYVQLSKLYLSIEKEAQAAKSKTQKLDTFIAQIEQISKKISETTPSKKKKQTTPDTSTKKACDTKTETSEEFNLDQSIQIAKDLLFEIEMEYKGKQRFAAETIAVNELFKLCAHIRHWDNVLKYPLNHHPYHRKTASPSGLAVHLRQYFGKSFDHGSSGCN